ncbi:MAG: pepsin-like aspartyl protease, partial [Polyangiaceae bacterium]|nr:pepsin-like aspartyl protease [Polyangiaceae bacterium]
MQQRCTVTAWLGVAALVVGCGNASDSVPAGFDSEPGGARSDSGSGTASVGPRGADAGADARDAYQSPAPSTATSDASAGGAQPGDASTAANASGANGGTQDAQAAQSSGGAEAGAPESGAPESGATSTAFAAIPLSTQDGTYYTADVTVGSATFALDIDTGSGTAGIAGASCTNCSAAGISPLYTPSSTATDQARMTGSTYADGSTWKGEIYQDTVSLEHGTPSVKLDLVDIQTENQFFKSGTTFQGILGLGPSQLELQGTQTYFAQATAAGVAPVMGFELCPTSGTMWLGGVDPSAAASAIQYTPLVTSGKTSSYYSIIIDDLSVGGTSLGFKAADFEDPIVDTGTSLFYLPTPVYSALITAVNGSSGTA